MPLEEFFTGPFMTALEPGEIVTEIRVPAPGPREAGTYLKIERMAWPETPGGLFAPTGEIHRQDLMKSA